TSAKVFSSTDLEAPGIGLSSGGRFHHQGQSVLYLAENEQLSMIETLDKPNDASLIWIQKYRQHKTLEKILDLRNDWTNMSYSTSELIEALITTGFTYEKVEDRSTYWRPQYFVTNFISDCARQAGFEGIIYNSTRGSGSNIVLFNPDDEKISPIGKPKVFIYDPKDSIDNESIDDLTSVF
ncbi:RES family NAD+ phosphorylase, partial [Cytobacillus kochii]|uniref:RES family NAD+ phosphorylase n=1 Tax=Cytobacillus kochii TaxID=859143 RepID=UPI001CD5200A